MNWRWIRRVEPVPLLCWSGPAVLELTSEQPSFLSTTHFTGAHLNIHVKIVSSQYSFFPFFSPSIFISKSNMGHESMCMHKEYQPYDCWSERVAGGRQAKCWGRTRAEETVLFLSLWKLLKAALLSCDTVRSEGIDRQRRVCLWRRRQMYSSPSSHDLALPKQKKNKKKNRDRPAREATGFCFSSHSCFFLSWYLSVTGILHLPQNTIGGSLNVQRI